MVAQSSFSVTRGYYSGGGGGGLIKGQPLFKGLWQVRSRKWFMVTILFTDFLFSYKIIEYGREKKIK